MSLFHLVVLALLFLVTSIVGVVTGSNSLITVPVMFQFGIDEKVAIATNMFGLTFMAVGGTIPFVRQQTIEFGKLWPFIIVTVIGSAIGAALVGLITNQGIKIIVSVGMVVIVLFTLYRPGRSERALAVEEPPARMKDARGDFSITAIALVLTFFLAIYGGLYSGGYLTVLTATFVAFASMTFTESIAATKLINVFSSGIATLVFMWQGLVDYRLGVILGIAMFVGAYAGAHFATRMNEVWLKRIFLSTVMILAVKMFYDFL